MGVDPFREDTFALPTHPLHFAIKALTESRHILHNIDSVAAKTQAYLHFAKLPRIKIDYSNEDVVCVSIWSILIELVDSCAQGMPSTSLVGIFQSLVQVLHHRIAMLHDFDVSSVMYSRVTSNMPVPSWRRSVRVITLLIFLLDRIVQHVAAVPLSRNVEIVAVLLSCCSRCCRVSELSMECSGSMTFSRRQSGNVVSLMRLLLYQNANLCRTGKALLAKLCSKFTPYASATFEKLCTTACSFELAGVQSHLSLKCACRLLALPTHELSLVEATCNDMLDCLVIGVVQSATGLPAPMLPSIVGAILSLTYNRSLTEFEMAFILLPSLLASDSSVTREVALCAWLCFLMSAELPLQVPVAVLFVNSYSVHRFTSWTCCPT
mmetsp:Transcript_6490/g.19714  ORF Transcript_6490/g.19714 Transcript_6490/m.19714 type:complete len:379 (-) Transcript_6490:1236-2372(-)